MEELAIRSPINNAPIYFKPVVSSTMDEAAVLADAGAIAGTVVLTDFQKRGRGSRGARAWEAAAGDNLLFTVLLSAGDGAARLPVTPLAAGLGVALAIEALYSLPAQIKWPNDVLVQGKKLTGILCLAHAPFVLAGIGINCNQSAFDGELAERATSLALLLGRPVDRRALLLAVLENLERALRSPDWRAGIEARLAFRGERRAFKTGEGRSEETVTGTVAGVGESGELLFRREDTGRVERFFSGSLVERSV